MMGNRLRQSIVALLVICILFTFAFKFPVPYYITQPGTAMELAPLVSVDERHEITGMFMLTTIRMINGNPFNYAQARFSDYVELVPKRTLLAHYRDEEHYAQRQQQVMLSSQETAILVAYKLAGKKVVVEDEGVVVTQTLQGMPARELLQSGDMITHLDNMRMKASEEMQAYVRQKKIGDEIKITFIRSGETMQGSLTIAELPSNAEDMEAPRSGIGIGLATQRTISEVDPPVQFNTQGIGGPSAGLMFTLEVYNQLVEEDITKGNRIAGTGTIGIDGQVGRIGGVHQKVVAAHKAKADIFFVPNENGAVNSNYIVANKAAENIGTTMRIVPVNTIEDAIHYLKAL
jgi:PDZ domain-containing protein